MYFKDRPEAGRQIADRLEKYAHDKCVVLSLSAGGVIVGAQVAMRLNCQLMFLLSENIYLPGEPEALGSLTETSFSYSSKLTKPDLEEINSEFHGVIDQEIITKRHKLNQLITAETKVTPADLRDKIVIAISDGFDDTLALDVLSDFIKPIRIKRLVLASPLSNIKALDRMHVLADELVVLNVKENIVSINHHYDNNVLLNHLGLTKVIHNII
jgi:putative phosphoribosyl transferase